MMRVALCMAPASIAHEVPLFGAMPDTELTIVADRGGWHDGREVVLPMLRAPGRLGRDEASTAGLTWLRGMGAVPGPIDVVASTELLSPRTIQAARLARKHGAVHAVVIFANIAGTPFYRWPPWRQIMKRTARQADLFVCLTEMARDHAIELGVPEDRCHVVYPGIDTTAFHPPAQGRPLKPVVLFVGQLRADRSVNKGVMDVIGACDRVASTVPDLELWMVGDGPLRPTVEAAAAERPYLRFRARVPHDELPEVFRQARAFALGAKQTPRGAEQFGVVLAEAMATGLPVVTTRSGAIPEVVPSWNPVVAEGDQAALAAGIAAALGPDGADWGRRNRIACVERFDLAGQGRALHAVLQAAVLQAAVNSGH